MTKEELKQIWDKYYERLIYLALLYTHDRETAEEIIQLVFIRFWQQYRDSNYQIEFDKIRTYLYSITGQVYKESLKDLKFIAKLQNKKFRPSSDTISPDDIIRVEALSKFHEVVHDLTDRQREILYLHWDRYSTEQIAGKLQLTAEEILQEKAQIKMAIGKDEKTINMVRALGMYID